MAGFSRSFWIVMLIAACIAGFLISSWDATGRSAYTYEELRALGIVSGFGQSIGDPLGEIDRIPPIQKPSYRSLQEGLYPDDELCIGTETLDGWRFAPLYILDGHEIVNHGKEAALCFCPLAGMAISVPGKMHVSGLLKYDTFVLYRDHDSKLLLPFRQSGVSDDATFPLRAIHLLTYEGVLSHFPDAQILDPTRYRGSQTAYGSYPTDRRMGIGHPKPGLATAYAEKHHGFHPKERALLVGFGGRIQKAYPFAAIQRRVPREGGSFTDRVGDHDVTISFDPDTQWARAQSIDGKSLNVGYTYIFALIQHLPDIPLLR